MLAFGAILEPRWTLEPPRDPRDRFWTDFGLILNRFWIDFGSILNDLGVHFLMNSKQCIDSQVQVERLLSGCRIIRSHARLLRSYSKWATQCHCLAYLFACLLTCFLACLLSSLLTCLLACLLVCLLTYLLACLLDCVLAHLLAYVFAFLASWMLVLFAAWHSNPRHGGGYAEGKYIYIYI